jgi:hypothetical protein
MGALSRPYWACCIRWFVRGLVVLLADLTADAGVLRTRFTTVLLDDLPIGYATRLQLEDGSRYAIENTSSRDVELRFAVQKPSWVEPTAGMPRYRPIPDIAWVALDPISATLPAGGQAEVEVVIQAPDDPAHANQHYEFWLQARTVPPGVAGVSLLTRVRFSTVAALTPEQEARLVIVDESESGAADDEPDVTPARTEPVGLDDEG